MAMQFRDVGRGAILTSTVAMAFAATVLFAVRPFEPASPKRVAPPANAGATATFEENLGQIDTRVKFISRGAGYTQFVTDRDVVWRMGGSAVYLGFPGATPATVTGSEELAARSNYLRGKDARQWVRGARQFSAVTLGQLYPGIDLKLHSSRQAPEYDFIVAPRADASAIRLRFTGAESVSVGTQGELVVRAGGGELIHHKPVAFQKDGLGQTTWVEARFAQESAGVLRFELGAYDQARELIIDPVYEYSTYLGGTGSEMTSGFTAQDPQ